ASPSERVLPVIAERLRHLLAEVAAELGREEAQEPAEDPIRARQAHVLNNALRLASARVCSRRADSARATSRPNRVSWYRRRRASPPSAVSLISPSASRRLMMP